jgi:hypothetical protein
MRARRLGTLAGTGEINVRGIGKISYSINVFWTNVRN